MLGCGSPLLNLVLQFAVFITLVATCSREMKVDVDLPLASSVRDGPSVPDVLYVNIDYKGRIYVFADEDYADQVYFRALRIRRYLDREFCGCAKQNVMVIIRADRDCPFASVWTVIREARPAGFKRMQLRVSVVR